MSYFKEDTGHELSVLITKTDVKFNIWMCFRKICAFAANVAMD